MYSLAITLSISSKKTCLFAHSRTDMEAIPAYNIVICEIVNAKEEETSTGSFIYKKENLPEYKIVKTGDMSDDFRFKVGDTVVINSIPTKIVLEDKTQYAVKCENIVGYIA